MTAFLTVVHVILCVLLIVAVLLQSGKGGGLAASVGGGRSSSVLGGRAATSFLSKVTTYLASSFLVMCLILAVLYDDDEGAPTSATERILQTQGSPAAAPFDPAPIEQAPGDGEEAASALPQ